VPWRDQCHYAQGLSQGIGKILWQFGRNRYSTHPPRLPGGVVQDVITTVDFAFSFGNRLALFPCEEPRYLVLFRSQQVCGAFNNLTALRRGHSRPHWKGLTGRCKSSICLPGGSEATLTEDFVLVGRIPDFDLTALAKGNPFAADVIADFNHESTPPNQRNY